MVVHFKRLNAFWNWLPAFRAVAETEHLPTASKQLNVTPSALSRTVRLLEEEVGQELFERRGRRLVLSPAGEVMLRVVRRAMRTVHEGLLTLDDARFRGAINISAPGPFVPPLLLPMLGSLSTVHPDLIPSIHAVGGSKVDQAIRQGWLDLALLDAPLPDTGLHVEPLLELKHDVYCSPDHPLATHPNPGELLSEVPFATPLADEHGNTPDAWPIERPRRIGLRVMMMQVAIDAVQHGGFVSVLPELVGVFSNLTALDVSGIPNTTLYMLHRPSLEIHGRVEYVAEQVRESIGAVEARLEKARAARRAERASWGGG